MPRPPKWRCVDFVPPVSQFRPVGVPLQLLEMVRLSLEEAEAIRLRDYQGLEQEICAEQMHVSRPTFHRVLASARRKLADAVVNGKAFRVEGGNYEMAKRQFRCANDGYEWTVPFEQMIGDTPPVCPQCHSLDAAPIGPPFGRGRRGWGRGRHGRGWQR